MKSIMTFFGVLIILAAIAAVFYGGYQIVGYIWQLYAGLEATLRLILLSTFVVFLFGCFIVSGAIKSSAQIKLKGQLAELKIDLYKSLIGLYEQYFSGAESGMGSQTDLLTSLAALNAELTVIAGSAVIESHRKLEAALSHCEGDDKSQALYQQLIKKMRLDLGHGTHIDETKLKFLVTRDQAGQSGSEGHGVDA